MDKHFLLQAVLHKIRSQISESELKLAEILQRANEAPGAMQSHSDTDKNLYGRQAAGQKEAIDMMKHEHALTEMLSLEPSAEVIVGSLVVLEDEKGIHHYFLLHGGGGITVEGEEGNVTVVTPRTPLGSALIGKKKAETVGVASRILTILDIC